LRLLKVGVHRVSGLPDAPASAQRQPTGTALVVLVPLGASIAVVQARLHEGAQDDGQSAGDGYRGGVTVRSVAPELADERVLATDDSSGGGVLSRPPWTGRTGSHSARRSGLSGCCLAPPRC
jgi:hypothetical protein